MVDTTSTPARLSSAARRRGLIVLVVDTFLMWGGFFMVIPLIAVHYVDGLGWAAASIGLVLGTRQMVQQGLTVFGGALADRIGAKGLIWLGLLIRALGFAGMAWADTFALLLASGLLAGAGGALFESPRMAALTALAEPEQRSRVFALVGVAGGVGMSVGPLLGALLIRVDFVFVSLAAAACFVLAALITLLFLPAVRVSTERHSLTYGIVRALRDGPFMVFTVLLMGYWFLWVQLMISLPLAAETTSGTADAVSWVYGLTAGMQVLLQYPLLRLAERWLRPMQILILGVALMALGLGGVVLAASLPLLLACVALFSVGVVLSTPTQQTVTAALSDETLLGSYFGVNSLALALGGGVGSMCGGLLYDTSRQIGLPALPWLVFCVIGLAAAAGLALLDARLQASAAYASRLAAGAAK